VLDIRTLMISTGIMSLMLGGVIYVAVRGYAADARGALLVWARGQLVQPLGWFLIALRQQVPDFLSMVVGNVLVAAGLIACIHALDLFAGRRPRHELYALLVLINTGVMIWFSYATPSSAGRAIGGSLVLMLVFLLCVRAALAMPQAFARAGSHWVTAGVFALGTMVLAARILARLPDLGEQPGTVFVATRMEQFVFAYLNFVNVIGSFGFVLMCNDRANATLVRLAAEDSLTGVFNRRTFEQHAMLALQQSQRSGRPLALLLIDGDHFKRINDEFGHAAGDEALRRYTQIFRAGLRAGDVVGRIGGEEFGVLLLDCSEAEAHNLGERLRAAIAAHDFRHDGRAIPLRVSVGVAALRNDDFGFEALLRRADRALYAAKNAGRNRVASASSLVEEDKA